MILNLLKGSESILILNSSPQNGLRQNERANIIFWAKLRPI